VKKYLIYLFLIPLLALIYYFFYKGYLYPNFYKDFLFTEAEARSITPRGCYDKPELYGMARFDADEYAWIFPRPVNTAKPGCKPVCIVHKDTRLANTGWLCK